MKKITLLFLCIFSFSIIKSQTTTTPLDKTKNGSNYFGINGGVTSGLGLSYTHGFNKNAFQVTFLPLFDKDVKKYSIALTYLRFVTSDENVNFLFFLGNHYTNLITEKPVYNIGIGPGIEAGSENCKVRFMVGYGILNIPTNIMSRPIAELGLFYKF